MSKQRLIPLSLSSIVQTSSDLVPTSFHLVQLLSSYLSIVTHGVYSKFVVVVDLRLVVVHQV